jgi:transcriptional regulator with XRE-family HTH domain
VSAFVPSRLTDARRRAGISREHMAVAVGRSYHTIACYERGTFTPPPDVINKLADVLGISQDALFRNSQDLVSGGAR